MMLVALPSSLLAGIHLEPYLGLQMGGVKDDATYESTVGVGTLIGGRVGFGMLGAFAALDIATSSHEMTTKITGLNLEVKKDVDMLEKAIAVGYKVPVIPLKGMLKVIFGHTTKGDGMSKMDASGLALAVGFTMIPFVDLNVEYKMLKSDIAGDDSKMNLLLLSASAPFNLL